MSTTDVKDAAESKRATQEEHQQQESVLIERVNSVSLTFTTSAIEAALGNEALDLRGDHTRTQCAHRASGSRG